MTDRDVPPENGPPSIWFPDPGFGMPNATTEELAAESEDVKALRFLRTLRAYVAQTEHPFSAVKLDGNELVVMRVAHFASLMDSLQWLYRWQRRAAERMQAIHADLEHELTESGHLADLEQRLADEFEDGDDE